MDNAVRFGGDRLIEVYAERRPEQAVVKVVDHGTGIPMADRPRILERFQRAAPSNHFGGFGLGLWMACHIARAHGGAIDLSDTPNGVTTVTVSLPFDAAVKARTATGKPGRP